MREVFSRFPLFWLALAAALGIFSMKLGSPALLIGLASVCASASFSQRLRWWMIVAATFFTFALYAQVRSYSIHPAHLYSILNNTELQHSHFLWRVRGFVADKPRRRVSLEGKARWELMLEVISIEREGTSFQTQGRVLASINDPLPRPIYYGDMIKFEGRMRQARRAANPGQFDYRAWLANRGIRYIVYPQKDTLQMIERGRGYCLRRFAIHVREKILKTFEVPTLFELPKEIVIRDSLRLRLQDQGQINSLMSGMLLGYSDGIDEELQQAFRDTGTIHLFAISGQNVAIMGAILLLVLEMLGIVRWHWGWVLIPLIFVFCLATGMSASAARAFVMAAITYIGWKVYRPIEPFNILGASALLVWVWDPRQVFEAGFQLSYLIVIVLLLFTLPLTRWLYRWAALDPWLPKRIIPKSRLWLDRVYYLFCAALSVAFVAWVGSAPLILYYFHQCTPIAPLANICLAPLASIIVLLSTLSVCLGAFWTGFSVVLNSVASIVMQITVFLVTFLAQIPGGHFYVNPAMWAETDQPRLIILQANQASPMIISHHGQHWLVDTGSLSAWRGVTFAAQRYLGINHWEGVVLSQMSTKDTGGALELLRQDSVGWWATSSRLSASFAQQKLEQKMAQYRVGRRFWRAGDRVKLDKEIGFEILWPLQEMDSYTQGNLIFMMHVGSKKVLWASDASERVMLGLLERAISLDADILIQGGKYAPSQEWLKAVSPDMWILPVSNDGQKRNNALELAKELNIKLLDMSKTGAVTINKSKNGELSLRTFLGP